MYQLPDSDLSLAEVVKITGLSNDLIRLYEKEFDLVIPRTSGGHRRYNKENVEEIIKIKKMVQEQKLSYKEIRNIRAGLIPAAPETSAAAATPDELKELREAVERMEDNMAKLLTLNEAMAKKMDDQQRYIEGALETRQQALMLEIRTRLEEKQKRGFFQKLFGGRQ